MRRPILPSIGSDFKLTHYLQVRSLLTYGLVELRDGRLAKIDGARKPRPININHEELVTAMRNLLSDDA